MKCGRLQLQERLQPRPRAAVASDRARRYCQRRMIDPGHEEDPRWRDGVMERFHCTLHDGDHIPYGEEPNFNHNSSGDIFLSVQTLQFQGNSKEQKQPRTCFKYKALTHGNRHRMFVKEIVEDHDDPEEDCSSQQNSFYMDEYFQYIMSSDRSRPSTGKSSLYMREDNRVSRDKAVQVELKRSNLKGKQVNKPNSLLKKSVKLEENIIPNVFSKESIDSAMDNAKIAYHKSGKRKSITISRAQSPETVQVIRVDVVCCNYSNTGSAISNLDEMKKPSKIEEVQSNMKGIKNNNFANKYLLTKTIKSLDENVSGGAKVTLLCKTYRLADRVRVLNEGKKPIHPIKTKTFGSRNKTTVIK